MAELTILELKTSLAAAENALLRAENRATAGQLALEMIHEIRNPLQALSNQLSLPGKRPRTRTK